MSNEASSLEWTTPPEPTGPGPVPWRAWECIPVFVIALFVSSLLAVPLFALASTDAARTLGTGLIFELSLGGTVLAWALGVRRGTLAHLGLKRPVLPAIGMGLALGIGVWGVANFVLAPLIGFLLQHVSPQHVRAPRQLPAHLSGAEAAIAVAFVLSAAPCEELFFRGFLFGGLRNRFGFLVSAVVSAAAFGASHFMGRWQNGVLLVSTMFFVGFAFAFIYERRDNLAANIAAHALFNLVGVTLILVFTA